MLPALLLCLLPLAPPASEPHAGRWCAELASPGGRLPFTLTLERTPEAWSASLATGPDEPDGAAGIEAHVEADGLVLAFPHYDAEIRARIEAEGRELVGTWRRRATGGRTAELGFRARW